MAVAYESAQDRAASQIIGWLAENATARVGPRGAQVAMPVELIEAATIRHYTSRAGDPHRHLHVQVNSRVFADGKWRGIDTVSVRDSLAAINGIGHAAVMCDPEFRAALTGHGYTLNSGGKIEQLAPFVGPFSQRAAQIEANLDRYEWEWTQAHPGEQPGPALRRAWDARAWADGRPDKVVPEPGVNVQARWLAKLAALGYRDHDRPIQLTLPLAGQVDRDRAAVEVLTRLGAARSAWNAADVRGGVEQLLARAGMVADAAVRRELAEDLTTCALADCVPLLAREVPAHVRSLTSPQVLDVEADLTGRLAVRGTEPTRPGDVVEVRDDRLDEGQLEAVAVLAGPAALAVVEGAAGAGKTTMLAETRRQLTVQGHRLIVVTPTLKAAQAESAELGAQAGSAAWLAHQHGWRWDDTGAWTRLRPGDADPATGRVYAGPIAVAALAPGDLLLVDEAGMLDQDSARALLMIADETGARLAVVGDRHQLPAVGRGGVLDLAVRWADPQTCATLDAVHRFTRRVDGVDVPDRDYAALTLAMRTGEDPDIVFDRLHSRGQVRIHADDDARRTVIADEAAADHVLGRSVAVVVDTREQAADLNTATRDRLIAAGRVDDTTTASTATGQRIGAGDTIATRRNDYTLAVANRDTWTVTEVHREGRLTVTSPSHGRRDLPAGYVREHVELAYATTAHGVQGDTTDTAYVVLTDRTGAGAAYVGMTRGRHDNTVHLVAADLDDARQQWTAAFGRDRADLGPAHAAALAAREAAGYRPAEAAQVVRAPVATLRYWRHLGKGPKSFRAGHRVFYSRSDIEAWIMAQRDGDGRPGAA
ncbi:MAG TPA: AAA family ATPase [Jatrophihabitantaceae bacterium]|nr:AAA family ATPase [Jatrophihabitantaceae bacterium]